MSHFLLVESKEILEKQPTLVTSVETETANQLQRLNNQLRKQLYDLHNLFEITLELNSILDENQLLHAYLLNLFGLLSPKIALILLNSENDPHTFTPICYRGLSQEKARHLTIHSTDKFLEIFSKNKQVVTVEEQQNDNMAIDYLKKVQSVGGYLIAPLTRRNKYMGLIILGEKFNKRTYSQSEKEMFSLLTNFLAVALSNVRLYKEMERVSVTDPLTNLFNRRYFENFLQNEIARARRFNQPLSLVMMDVDYFKNYNDVLGHPAGDKLLKDLAKVLKKTARRSDIVARYGGEEFCVILPQISGKGASSFSERLRNIVYTYPFQKREIQPGGHLTISLGVATYPYDAMMMKELIHKADTALYHAKKTGRNKVVLYSQLQ